jgi:putative hydrolase of the HAD superfamily
MIRAVLLDAMGTLLELEQPSGPLVEQLARRGVEISEDEARTAMRAEIAYYREHHDEGSTHGRLARLRRRCTEVLREALPPHAGAVDLDELQAALLAALRFEPFAEVAGVLGELGAAGVGRIVVSNWDISLHEQLEETGLAALVDGAISSAEAGAAKPDPAIFAHALRLAGVDAGDALMIGDDLVADVRGAERAGIAALLVDRSADGAPAAGAIRSLSELPRLVRSLS